MDVLVDQLGYEPSAPKRAVVQCDPGEAPDSIRVEDASSAETVATLTPEHAGHVEDWNEWDYWTVDLSDVEQPGEYVLAVTADDGEVAARSRPFEVDGDLLLTETLPAVVRYFRAERCVGIYDRADREAPIAGDTEETIDVSGGWYDASGDFSKYLSHLSYANYWNPQHIPLVAWALLDARETLDSEVDIGRSALHSTADAVGYDALEEARFGADFLVRMQDDDGFFYMTVFDQWSSNPDRRVVCAYEGFDGEITEDYEAGFRQGGGVSIAALARASRLDAGGGEFSTEEYLEAALTGFEHLQEHNEAYLDDGTENVIDDYCALLAATELAAAAGEADGLDPERFAAAATDRADSLLGRQTADGWFRAGDGDRPFFHAAEEGLPIVALCRYLRVLGEAPGIDIPNEAAVRSAIREYWSWELDLTEAVVNPFGYARQYAQSVEEDEPAARFFVPHENETGYWWQGENARLGSLAAAAHRSRAVLDLGGGSGDDDLADALDRFARAQLHWILGRNPFDVSMLEGVGNEAAPFLDGAPNTPGGIVNGITAGVDDESDIAFAPDSYADDGEYAWRWGEQWLPHAAWFLVAATWQSTS